MCVMQFARSPGKSGSHFNPSSRLFQPNEKKDIIASTASWLAMVGVLAGLTFVMGPIRMLKLYGVPYLVRATCPLLQARPPNSFAGNLCGCCLCVQVFVAWLDMVTYLHHHGHEDKLPWYRGKVNIYKTAFQFVDISRWL